MAVPLIFLLGAGSDALRSLEWHTYDLGVRFSFARPANENVVIVGLDAASGKRFGEWPWPRDVLATLDARLRAAGAAVIGYALPFHRPQNAQALGVLGELDGRGSGSGARHLLQEARRRLDTDRTLAASLRRDGAAVLTMDYVAGTAERTAPVLERASLKAVRGPAAADLDLPFLFPSPRPPGAARLLAPVHEIADAAGDLGHGLPLAVGPETVRSNPLVLYYGERPVASFPLLVAARTLGLDRSAIRVEDGRVVTLAGASLATAPGLRALPFFYRAKDGKPPFPVYSFADVYDGKLAAETFRGKTVLVGITDPRWVRELPTPLGRSMPPVLIMAHTVSSLLNGDLFHMPPWPQWLQGLLLLAVALYLALVLPRFRLGTGIAVTALLLVGMLNAHFLLMMARSLWVPLAVPMTALLVGHTLLAFRWRLEGRVRAVQGELTESNRMLAVSYQSQGQLDQAFEKYRRCLMDEPLCNALYSLGQDYERKRQFSRAAEVFGCIAEHDPKFRDVRERIARNQEMEQMFVLGKGGTNTGGGTLIISSNGLQKPMLGRYQVEREIGRGAMGMVYLGKDPKIGRTVAIKTMALSQEFEGDVLEDVKQRFFREAETAGRLNHPNIVTIYDVGEERDLAYIAMDYLKGQNLLAYCKPDTLLPAKAVFDIVIKVAEALEYAHAQRVVHRDIKPANIIYDQASAAVKVTDFGVAHLTDASKTKTGTILGSPSYMSPEQLAGGRVDGRSDLFSLGISLYQLLAGELPFTGESLASLMYKIANERHPDVRMFRPDLPSCVSKIMNKALHKEIERRFQTGKQFAEALRRCQERLTGKGP